MIFMMALPKFLADKVTQCKDYNFSVHLRFGMLWRDCFEYTGD